MNIDGVFLHYLIEEIKTNIINTRINKIIPVSSDSFIMSLGNKKQLFFSLNSNSSHIRFTDNEYFPSQKVTSFQSFLKNKLSSSIINNIEQINNDRIILFSLTSYDDLGYQSILKLYFEVYGRNSNLILTDEENIILDAYKRNMPSDDEKRIILPKVKYEIQRTNKINPFKEKSTLDYNNFEGVGELLFREMNYLSTQDVIFQKIKPTIYFSENKIFFYCFDLKHFVSEKVKEFDNLSEMLEYYFSEIKNITSLNNEQIYINNYLKKEIAKLKVKLAKQEKEMNDALNNLGFEKLGNLLSSNLYKIKKGDTHLIVQDFYNNNEEIDISLNPLLSPTQNLEHVYSKYKKAKRTISHLEEQIALTKKDIEYHECLLEQVEISKSLDIKEIYDELKIKKTKANKKNPSKPNITSFHDNEGNTVFVGKNNIQNNYLTHTIANKNDYFFHVQGTSGSHTILRCEHLTESAINTAALIAAYYSKKRLSANVAVDYTLVKNIKKVPQTKGSFVIYTNYKTVFVTPSLEEIKQRTKI